MRGRTVLLVVALALGTALVGFYAGMSTSTPKAVATGAATKGSPPKDSADKASAPKKGGNQPGTATQSSHPPATPPSSKPQPEAGPVRFGPVTTAGRQHDTAIAPDRRAPTAAFSDFEVTVGPASEPDTTRTFTMTAPLTDGAPGETLGVHAAGFVALDRGADDEASGYLNILSIGVGID